MNQIDIVGLGEVVVDWVAEIPHFPKPDEKINALSENIFPGGVTANYLVAVARLGGKSGFIGAVGSDPYGDFLISDFNKEKVDTNWTIKKKDKKTPVNFIFIVKGEKSIIQSPHMLKTKVEISDLDDFSICKSKLLHTTMIHQDITEKAIEIAKKNDVNVSIDLESQIAQSGWSNLKKMLLKADIIIPNKEGAKTITNSKTPKEAANVLIKKGIPIVIITMGSKGVLLTTKQYQKMIPAYNIKNIVDTTGAGDTFNGAFSLAYWIKKWSLEKSCKYANAAAALKIQELGARTGMPNETLLIAFLKENDESFFD
ncbi:MAG: carbohydrate kinase family protein [Candidatus Lokiarchaeota archaeon]|jgi:ribokinase|nr:carbohydrate kinase family protein [Candidatus Lokiarchaeota archaeon]